MTVKRAREILGENYAKLSDDEINEIVNFLDKLAGLEIELRKNSPNAL